MSFYRLHAFSLLRAFALLRAFVLSFGSDCLHTLVRVHGLTSPATV